MLEIINQIIQDKVKRNKSPAHALYSDLLRLMKAKGYTADKVTQTLGELKRNGKIEAGHTLNDIWIKIVHNDGKGNI